MANKGIGILSDLAWVLLVGDAHTHCMSKRCTFRPLSARPARAIDTLNCIDAIAERVDRVIDTIQAPA